MSNGITIAPDGEILVVNPLNNSIVVYSYDPDKNRLIEEQTIDTIRSLDNLVVDSSTGKKYTGGFVFIRDYLDVARAATFSSKKPTDTFISGGSVEITKLSKNKWKVEEKIIIPGLKYSGISVSARSDDKLIFGSWYDDGVLFCPYPLT